MAAHKKQTTPRTKKAAPKKRSVSISVSGDSSVKKLKLQRASKRAAVRTSATPEHVDAPAVLVSVDIDAGPARVSRYAGLFFMFVGVCFATYSLSGMYVELVELSTSDHQLSGIRLQRAETITSTLTNVNQVNVPAVPSITPDSLPNPSPTGAPGASSGASPDATQQPPTMQVPSTTTETVVPPVVTTIEQRLLQPPVELAFRGGDPHRDIEDIKIRVPGAKLVELVLVPAQTLTERYIGRASRAGDDYWLFKFDTKNVPNGEYSLFARISNQYGTYQGRSVPMKIKNDAIAQRPVESQEEHASSTTPSPIDVEIANATIEFKASEPQKDLGKEIVPMLIEKHPKTLPADLPATHVETRASSATTSLDDHQHTDEQLEPPTDVRPPAPPHVEQKAQEFVSSIEDDLRTMLELYGVAIRGNDSGAISQMEERIAHFENDITDKVSSTLVGEGMVASTDDAQMVRDRIIGLVREERERRAKEERLILDRVGDKIQRDSDRDGISDYDESHLYKTDPYVADSDRDGYNDGAEVLSGFDPANDGREAMVSFEDPREEGTERPDLLAVTRLDVLAADSVETSSSTTEKNIIFAGTALPHSFVTLYIYSTPVVVTVKTNDDGSWSYAFDKELEDGQHQIYVGVTDNAGKIVAKSKPFAFVKTADAYSVGRIENEVVVASPEPPRLMSENAIVLTTSLVVIMIGLVLVLIGAYLTRKHHPSVVMTPVLSQ